MAWRGKVLGYLKSGMTDLKNCPEGQEEQAVKYVVMYAKEVRTAIDQRLGQQRDDMALQQIDLELRRIEGDFQKFVFGFARAIDQFAEQEEGAVYEMMGRLIQLADGWTASTTTSVTITSAATALNGAASQLNAMLKEPVDLGGGGGFEAQVPKNSEGPSSEASCFCPRGHLLLPIDGLVRFCDGCGRGRIPPCEQIYACSSCDHDLCMTCCTVPDGYFKRYVSEQRHRLPALECSHGPEDVATCEVRGNLALALGYLGQLEEAATLQKRNLEATESGFGFDHDLTVAARRALGRTFFNQACHLEEAVKLERLNVEILNRTRGPNHSDTLRAHGDLSVTLIRLGQVDEFKAMQRQPRLVLSSHVERHLRRWYPGFLKTFVAYDVSVSQSVSQSGF